MEEQVNGSPKRKIWKILLLILLALVGIAATVWFVAFRVNVFSLNIVLNGDRDMIIEYGETYQEPGGQVYLQGTLFLQEGILLEEATLQISGEVQEDLLGIYPVTYEAEYGLWKASMERSILVMDTKCPVIELVPGPEETILPGTVYEPRIIMTVTLRTGSSAGKKWVSSLMPWWIPPEIPAMPAVRFLTMTRNRRSCP